MRFGVLGPLLVHDGDGRVDIPAPRQRTLLAALVLRAGRAVPAEKLSEELWDGGPPAAAAVTLRTHVMRLRQVLGLKAAARVLTRSGCYQLDVCEAEVDHLLFAALCSRGGAAAAAGRWRQADCALSEALGLWRGAPLADVASECLRSETVPHLEQLRLQALEWRNDARLSLGRHGELLADLQALVAEHPLRERFHAQLMLAVYRCGRYADALSAFRHARLLMVEELVSSPGPSCGNCTRGCSPRTGRSMSATWHRPWSRPWTPCRSSCRQRSAISPVGNARWPRWPPNWVRLTLRRARGRW